MAWETLMQRQVARATKLAGDALLRWNAAKAAARADNYEPKQFASDVVRLWADTLDLWWSPFVCASPVLPTLLISDLAGSPGPASGTVALGEDTDTASVVLTDLGLIGGTTTIPVGDLSHEVKDGSLLAVEVTNIPKDTGCYQGLALQGGAPIAVIIVQAT